MNIVKDVKFTRVSNAVAAGTSTVNSSAVDMKGFHAVTFAVLIGSIGDSPTTTAVDIKVQQTDDNTASPETWADLTGTKVSYTSSGDNKIALVEVTAPRERYLRCVVERSGGDSVIDGIIAMQSGPADAPVTQDSSTVVGAEHHGPGTAEGTA